MPSICQGHEHKKARTLITRKQEHRKTGENEHQKTRNAQTKHGSRGILCPAYAKDMKYMKYMKCKQSRNSRIEHSQSLMPQAQKFNAYTSIYVAACAQRLGTLRLLVLRVVFCLCNGGRGGIWTQVRGCIALARRAAGGAVAGVPQPFQRHIKNKKNKTSTTNKNIRQHTR